MMYVTSPAGRRLAKAKAAYDKGDRSNPWPEADWDPELAEVIQAASAVADELISQGFHEMEGD